MAVGLARQEVPTRLLARIADDLLGHRLRAHLDGNRVDLSYAVRAAEPTSLAIVAVGRDGVVEYDFRVEGTADWQWRDDELAGALDGGVVALHAGSIALTMPPGADVLQRLLAGARQAITVTYDPNCRPLLMGSPTPSVAASSPWSPWPTWSRRAPTTWTGCPGRAPSRWPRPGWPRAPRWW